MRWGIIAFKTKSAGSQLLVQKVLIAAKNYVEEAMQNVFTMILKYNYEKKGYQCRAHHFNSIWD